MPTEPRLVLRSGLVPLNPADPRVRVLIIERHRPRRRWRRRLLLLALLVVVVSIAAIALPRL